MSQGTSTGRSRTPPRTRPTPDSRSLVSEGGVEVELHDEQGNCFYLKVLPTTRLRDVQKMLVTWLGLSFPLYSATITMSDGAVSDDFNDKPFQAARNGEKFTVKGELSSDMYFFDKMFKTRN